MDIDRPVVSQVFIPKGVTPEHWQFEIREVEMRLAPSPTLPHSLLYSSIYHGPAFGGFSAFFGT